LGAEEVLYSAEVNQFVASRWIEQGQETLCELVLGNNSSDCLDFSSLELLAKTKPWLNPFGGGHAFQSIA
jgi:hypothetical protein